MCPSPLGTIKRVKVFFNWKAKVSQDFVSAMSSYVQSRLSFDLVTSKNQYGSFTSVSDSVITEISTKSDACQAFDSQEIE